MKKYKQLLYYLVGSVFFIRLIYLNFVPLLPQEAYYWKYAKKLALSYFDHPPLTAYTIAFFTWLGNDNVFFIRIGSILYSLGMIILIYHICKMLFDDIRISFYTILMFNLTALFSIGTVIITPDVPFLFFWTLIVFSLVKLLKTGLAKWWYIAGISLGFALLSKYTAILIVPGIFLFILFSEKQRKWLLTVHPYFALILGLVVFTPVIYWNSQHDWCSFLFQSSNRFSEMKKLKLDYFFQLLGSQLGLLTPYIFLFAIIGWFKTGLKLFMDRDDKFSLLFWVALPVYLVFTLSSFRSLVKMNWIAPAYVTSIISAVALLLNDSSKFSKIFGKYLKPGLILALIIVIFMHILPIAPIFPIRKGDTWTGWQVLADRVMEVKNRMGDNTFIFGHEYKIPSEISYYTKNHVETHAGEIIGENGLQYTFWTDFDKLINKNAVFITSNAARYRNIGKIENYFIRVEEDEPIEIYYHNKLFRRFYIYRCYSYKGPLINDDSKDET